MLKLSENTNNAETNVKPTDQNLTPLTQTTATTTTTTTAAAAAATTALTSISENGMSLSTFSDLLCISVLMGGRLLQVTPIPRSSFQS